MAGRFTHLLDPVLQVSRLLGLFPLGRGLRRSFVYLLVTCVSFVLLLAAVSVIIYWFMVRESVRTDKHRMIISFRIAILSMVPMVNLFRILQFEEEIKSILEALQQTERALTKAKIVVFYNCKRTYTIAAVRVVFNLVIELVKFSTREKNFFEQLLKCCYFLSGGVLMQLVQLQLFCFLQIVESLMSSLQLLLFRPFILKEFDILTVLQAQNRLEMACSDLNRIYSLQMLFTIVFRYLSFITGTYDVMMSVIYYLKYSFDVSYILELALSAAWLLYAIMDLVFLAKACTNVVKEAENVNKALYKLLLITKQKDLLFCSKLKLHFAVGRRVQFSACGMFPLDFSLVHSVLASTFTFLVIMMQLD